ncbi:UvrD-helicase domain-containing protein [Saccharopolyspora cebuensis]|uniref:UvrD-helicase domain-containing protein n=1 Tax=Saccharopolyspora cebuensis TaxID=418759 RepID=A0ABV4CNS2_9PSEU
MPTAVELGGAVTGTFHPRDEQQDRSATGEPPWMRRVLARMRAEDGWYLLRSRSALPDAVLVGPPGVLVVLLRAEPPDLADTRAAFVRVAELLAGVGGPRGLLTEAVVRTVVVHPEGAAGFGRSGEHLVLGESELDRALRRGDPVLTAEEVRAVARHLDDRAEHLRPDWNPAVVPGQRGDPGLFEVADVRAQRVERALDKPFRDWRTFLDDTQLGVVRRHYSGPARITGPAGTGKSVLALHRLAYLARRTTGRLLFTTHVHNLPRIAKEDFRSLAPQLERRIEFVHLHALARDLLAARGRDAEVDEPRVDAAFTAVWRSPLAEPLRAHRPSKHYWRAEVERVIKGRGIREFEVYRTLARRGRGTHLPAAVRSQVWRFYCEYERELSERGAFDHNDVLMRALAELGRHPLPRPYAAVVVDEVQDLTLVGLRLVHALSGDGPNQLLLIGDGQQQVYPGGWRLSEAGIALRGRGEILRRNYRNRGAIVDRAGALPAINRFDDLDGGPTVNLAAAHPVLGGGQVVEWTGTDQEQALLTALRALDDPTDAVVLTRTRAAADRWEQVLRAAGIPVQPLDRWDRRSGGCCHVGTVHRAKGTEFRSVFLPDEQHHGGDRGDEREARERHRLVAMTRARDYLWIATR